MSLKTYSQMKGSGDTWLGQIPSHWQCLRLKTIATCNDEVLSESTPPETDLHYVEISDVAYDRGITGDTEVQFATAPSRARRVVRDGDIIVSTVRTYLKAIAKIQNPPENIVVSTGFAVVRPLNIASSYLGYALLAEHLIAEIISRSTGVSYPGINASEIMTLRVAVPPIPEQHAIAAFLDRETAKIDVLVAEQKRLIALLAEKRRAVISHAVTKGLDPNAPMKDSGIAWLGEVPAHWEVKHLKRLFQFIKRQEKSILSVLSVYRDFGVIEKSSRDDNINKTPDDLSLYQTIDSSYLVVNKMKAWQGSLGISQLRGITSPDYAAFRPIHVELDQFLNYLLRCQLLPDVYRSISNGIRPDQWRLEPDRFLQIQIALPSSMEQQAIAAHLDHETSKLDTLTTEAERAISLLKERRAALISAAVTGKIDVRDAVDAEEVAA